MVPIRGVTTSRFDRRVLSHFFNDVVKPSFKGKKGIVYVFPEIQIIKEIFESYYDVR